MIKDIFNLDKRVVVITVTAGLLGTHHAEAVAAFGGIPILIDLNKDKLESISENLYKKYKAQSASYVVDITNEDKIKKNVKEILSKFNKIDSLINNAANNPKIEDGTDTNFSRLENFSIDNWNSDLNVSLTGSFLCSKHYGYEISKNKNGGTIINISSDLGLIGPDQSLYLKKGVPENLQSVKPISYSVSKAGMLGLTKYLSTYWVNSNVRCNAICPGGIENNQSEEFLAKIKKKIPLNRFAQANEYQGTLIWMLSDAASYLNGAIVSVDGGRTSW